MELTADDILEAAAASHQALEPFVARDWSVQAGDLDWDVRRTVAHVCDAAEWYAAHLALQSPRRLRFDLRPHPDASNADLLDVLDAAAATLAAVARAAPPGARAYHNHGMADMTGFLAMGWTRSSSTAGTPSAASEPTSLHLRNSPSGFSAGSSPGHRPTSHRG